MEAYIRLKLLYDVGIVATETGLHLHPVYPFLAASPGRLVVENNDDGLLEVKCPIPKIGMTSEEACSKTNFCCQLEARVLRLKQLRGYYYLVQVQLSITRRKWCDFVVWTNNKSLKSLQAWGGSDSTTTSGTQLLPGLLYFAKPALFPEVITKHVKRPGVLYTKGQYVSFKKFCSGLYVCKQQESLKMKIRRLREPL